MLLAKALGLGFTDTDLVIQVHERRTLEAILINDGYLALRQIEAHVLQRLDATDQVIATGGSAVYSDAAMRHLQTFGPIVYLEVALATLKSRIGALQGRGIAGAPGATFESLAAERIPLYERYADIIVDADDNADGVVERTSRLLTSHPTLNRSSSQ